MLCTICGRGHVAASCPQRPRQRPALSALVAAVFAALVLGACAQTPEPPPARLVDPPADLMTAPPPPPEIPACEGERACRARYYARARADRADVAGRLTGLQRWVRAGKRPG